MNNFAVKLGNVIEDVNGNRYLVQYSNLFPFLKLPECDRAITRDESLDSLSIVKVYKDYTCSRVIWERKEVLLTPEEKEWLTTFIKPFRDKVETISLCDNGKFFIKVEIKDDYDINLPYIENMTFKFKGLKVEKDYTIEDLEL